MRFIPTLVHGIADYVVALVTLALPFALGLTGVPRISLFVLGILVLAYSLMTDYELGIVRFLRIRFHLLLDALFGIAMLMMPWLFDLSNASWPFIVIGALALVLTFTTQIRAIGTAATE
jgi:hypothetical protein